MFNRGFISMILVSANTTASATASTPSATSATRTESATTTASMQPKLKTIEDGTSNVVIALAVSLGIVSIAFVVVVTVMCRRRNSRMSTVDGSGTMTHKPLQASTSGTQYVNVVPPTYEQLSRQHTELSKDGRDHTYGDMSKRGQQ